MHGVILLGIEMDHVRRDQDYRSARLIFPPMLMTFAEFRRGITCFVQDRNGAKRTVLDDLAGLNKNDGWSVIVVVRWDDAILGDGQAAHAQLEIAHVAPAGQIDFMQDGSFDADVRRVLDLARCLEFLILWAASRKRGEGISGECCGEYSKAHGNLHFWTFEVAQTRLCVRRWKVPAISNLVK